MTQKRRKLTSERLQQVRFTPHRTAPPSEHAIKTAGVTEAQAGVFPILMPHCKRLEKEVANITDVTIYTLLYPVLNGSIPMATAIWCAPDRLKAWDDFMLKGIAPAGKTCETPIDTLIQAGQKNGISGTPTLIFADGSVAPGMIPAATIEKRLGASAK